MHLSIIGMSQRTDVISMLEKRIASRFSMRHLHTFLPTDIDDLFKVLMSKLRLPADCRLKATFVKEFNHHLEAALRAKGPQWQHHLDLGRPPAWFLWQCLPLAALLGDAATAETSAASTSAPTKRPRLSSAAASSQYLPATDAENTKLLLLGSISEAEHIVLIALWRLKARNLTLTLARVCHEVQILHEGGGYVAAFVQDRYCAAFERLLAMRLVRIGPAAGDVKRYQPCFSTVDGVYEALVQDLEKTSAGKVGQAWNPLRALPQTVQQWAGRTRRG